jgi:hypothetical protein
MFMEDLGIYAIYALLTLATAGAILFWSLGVVRGRQRYLLFGVAVIVGLCALPPALTGDLKLLGQSGAVLIVFGISSVLVGALSKPARPMSRASAIAIGIAAIVAGIILVKVF